MEEALQKAVDAADGVHLSDESSFEELCRALLQVAAAVADFNMIRLSSDIERIGAPVEKLPEEDSDQLSRVIEKGIGVATRMLEMVDNGEDNTRSYHLFVSNSAKERSLYVPLLNNLLETSVPGLHVFSVKEMCGMPAPRDEILRTALRAHCIVTVSCYHAVQRHWPVAELMCALAKFEACKGTKRSPLLIDAMPGSTWLQSANGEQRRPDRWVRDIQKLFPVQLPWMKELSEETVFEHVSEVAQIARLSFVQEAIKRATRTKERVEAATSATQLSFEELGDALLEVAKGVADINKIRMDYRSTGSAVATLLEGERDDLSDIIHFGVGIATSMLESEMLKPRDSEDPHDLFVSYPGQEGTDYVPKLISRLTAKNPGVRIFRDRTALHGVAGPQDEMLREVLRAKFILTVCSYHAVQKKWPVAELMCGLARNKRASDTYYRRSPLIMDAMPGMTWLQSDAGGQRRTRGWVDDVKALYPVKLPSMEGMSNESTEDHVDDLVALVTTRLTMQGN